MQSINKLIIVTILFSFTNLPVFSMDPNSFEWHEEGTPTTYRIQQIEKGQENILKQLKDLCDANANNDGAGFLFSRPSYDTIEGELQHLHGNKALKWKEREENGDYILEIVQKNDVPLQENERDFCSEMIGYYGFFLDAQLVGFIKMTSPHQIFQAIVEGEERIFATLECEMTMHPHYRGQGLGYKFRKKIQEKVIEPKLGLEIDYSKLYPSGKREQWPFILVGTCGFVHIENMASRKLLSKLKHTPVKLSTAPYLGEEAATQIFYVSHPIHIPVHLPKEIVGMILSNEVEHNQKIIEYTIPTLP
ncbi:MAG: hypothetical protein K2X02_02615 [Alphaproteobacteria bacterium]|nr:hypothetical protein [Alphaproteobacteria bacterium]